MLDHAREAVRWPGGNPAPNLDTDRKLNLEIISLRNRLIHGYDQVDFDILWTIVTEDLPPLIDTLGTILPATEV